MTYKTPPAYLGSDPARERKDYYPLSLIPVSNENFSFGRGGLQLAEGAPHW
ncbi:hypothetical protein [Streptomyces sp. LN499]|uniref:hypothetical protein n=1 Tax=Streptomyces sp. LN499 TaxID=3112977 RepID=UPI00371FF6AE